MSKKIKVPKFSKSSSRSAFSASLVVDYNQLPELIDTAPDFVADVIQSAANNIQGRARQKLIDYDAIITGDLYKSIHPVITKDAKNVFVEATEPYAVFVHEGTGTSRKYGPRPFLKEATDEHREYVQGHLAQKYVNYYRGRLR